MQPIYPPWVPGILTYGRADFTPFRHVGSFRLLLSACLGATEPHDARATLWNSDRRCKACFSPSESQVGAGQQANLPLSLYVCFVLRLIRPDSPLLLRGVSWLLAPVLPLYRVR